MKDESASENETERRNLERGARLKALRKAKDLKLREVGPLADVDQGQLSKWENGANFDINNAKKLARFYGVSLEHITMEESGVATQREHAPPAAMTLRPRRMVTFDAEDERFANLEPESAQREQEPAQANAARPIHTYQEWRETKSYTRCVECLNKLAEAGRWDVIAGLGCLLERLVGWTDTDWAALYKAKVDYYLQHIRGVLRDEDKRAREIRPVAQ